MIDVTLARVLAVLAGLCAPLVCAAQAMDRTAYLFFDDEYYRYSNGVGVDQGYPATNDGWELGGVDVNAAVTWDNGLIYLFLADSTYHRWDRDKGELTPGYPKAITSQLWDDVAVYAANIKAAINTDGKYVYFFLEGAGPSNTQYDGYYLSYNKATRSVDGGPTPVSAMWPFLATYADDITSAVNFWNGTSYLFLTNDRYLKWTTDENGVDVFSLNTTSENWDGVSETAEISAAFVNAPSPTDISIEDVGDLVAEAGSWARLARVVESEIPEFNEKYSSRDMIGSHVQGIAMTANGRIVLTHSLKDDGGCGALVYSDAYDYALGSGGAELSWTVDCPFEDKHPTTIQASGNIVAAPNRIEVPGDGAGNAYVQFFEFPRTGPAIERVDLRLKAGYYDSIAFFYSPQARRYFLIASNPDHHEAVTATLFRSATSEGRACSTLGPGCTFSEVGPCSDKVYMSSSGTSAVMQPDGTVALIAQYKSPVYSDDAEYVTVTEVDLSSGCVPTRRVTGKKLGQTQVTFATNRPSFRWGGGAQVIDNELYVLWAARNIGDPDYEFAIYRVPMTLSVSSDGGLPTLAACESNSECENDACGRATAADGAAKVCCPSGDLTNHSFFAYCTNMSKGSRCWTDAMCASDDCEGNGIFTTSRGTCN